MNYFYVTKLIVLIVSCHKGKVNTTSKEQSHSSLKLIY